MKSYEVKNELSLWPAFTVNVNKAGVVTWCSDGSHPPGANWSALKTFYESYEGDLKCIITEV